MKKIKYQFLSWLLLIVLMLLCFLVFYFHLSDYFNFTSLQQNHVFLSQWVYQHYIKSVLIFIGIYILAIASSTPIPVFLNIVSGFFFGLLLGTLYVLFAATIGAILVFFIVNTTLGEWVKNRANSWVAKMKKGLKHNTFNYLLVLRITPLFPIWVVNVVPAILNIPFRIFLITTLIGTIPGSFFYVAIGHGIMHIIDTEKNLSIRSIFTPTIWISVIVLTFLSLLPLLLISKKKKL